MAQATGTLLSATEHEVLQAWREMPDGDLKNRFEEFLVHLTRFMSEPACAEIQADGIPCDAASADCQQCLALDEMIKTLESTLPRR
jgi:hypothetical protein